VGAALARIRLIRAPAILKSGGPAALRLTARWAKGGSDGRHYCSHRTRSRGRSSRDSCIGTITITSPKSNGGARQMPGTRP
jgi:hypothetical protein